MVDENHPLVIDIGYAPETKWLILIVDDETAIHSVLFDALDSQFRLVSASNGREGLTKASKIKPDLIMMDIMMPDIGGYEAVRLLRSDPITKDIPIIIMTAQNFDESTVKLLKEEPNVYNFLPKPFRTKQLREMVTTAIENSKKKNN